MLTTKEQARKAGTLHLTKWNHSERHETDTNRFINTITQTPYWKTIPRSHIQYIKSRIRRGLPVDEYGKFHNPPKLNLSQNTLERIQKS